MIPKIRKVKAMFSYYSNESTLVYPAVEAGRKYRYNVVRIRHDLGTIRCIGRELPIDDAKYVAQRIPEEDGKPLPPKKLRKLF